MTHRRSSSTLQQFWSISSVTVSKVYIYTTFSVNAQCLSVLMNNLSFVFVFYQVQVVGSVQMARGVFGTISVWPAVKSTTTASVALRVLRTLARHEQRQDTFNLSASSTLSLPCEMIS